MAINDANESTHKKLYRFRPSAVEVVSYFLCFFLSCVYDRLQVKLTFNKVPLIWLI